MTEKSLVDVPRNDWTVDSFRRNWAGDLKAAFPLSFVSVVFAIAISDASGAPQIAGLYAAIIAGFICWAVRGPHLTISGPAAGLSMILYTCTEWLGNGDMVVGFGLLGAAIVVCGILQTIIAAMGWTRIGDRIPPAVTHGMLAGIGGIIFAKQLPMLWGSKFHHPELFEMIRELPTALSQFNGTVFIVGGACFALVFGLGWLKNRLDRNKKKVGWAASVLNWMPPQALTALVGLAIGMAVGLGQLNIIDAHSGKELSLLVQVPDPLKYGLHLPDFAGIFAGDVWLPWKFLTAVLMITAIDVVETTVTLRAVDANDPWHRRSELSRSLFGIGLANLLCGLVGGLTNIPGGVKSNLAINVGARTMWCSFFVSCMLVAYVFVPFTRNFMNMMPMAAMAAVIMHAGYKLCAPKEWVHSWHLGRMDFSSFAITAIVTMATDLLIGIAVGMIVHVLLLAFKATQQIPENQKGLARWRRMCLLGKDPVQFEADETGTPVIHVTSTVTCLNFHHLRRAIEQVVAAEIQVVVRFGEGAILVDHPSVQGLNLLKRQLKEQGRELMIESLYEKLTGIASHAEAPRVRTTAPSYESIAA